jgi:hypothetical protein
MQFNILSFFQNLSLVEYWWVIIILGIVLPVYFLWRGVKKDKKSQYFRQEHVFDFAFFSLVLGVLLSRLFYIFLNSDMFSDVRWFWIPYEKIQEQILWFESFPWLFFKMSLNTVAIEGFVIGFWGGIHVVKNIHRLNWKESSMALCDYIGLITAFGCWASYMYSKQEYLIYPVLILFILFLVKELTRGSFDIFKKLTSGIWKFFSIVALPLVIIYSKLRIGICCLLPWDIAISGVILIMCMYFLGVIFIQKREKPDKYENLRLDRKRIPTKPQKRNYTLSYRTLSGRWWQKLTSRFYSGDEDSTDNK